MTVVRSFTGVEIHPGAVLGRRVFVDHGSGVVVGETAVVGDDVTLYHQVTLGAVGWWHDNRRADGERRHPVVGDRVVLGANATVIGPVTIGLLEPGQWRPLLESEVRMLAGAPSVGNRGRRP